MEVVGHDAVGQDPHGVARGRLGEDAEEGVVIAVVVEDRGAGDGAVHGMVDQAALGGAGWSAHGIELSEDLTSRQERLLTPFLRIGGNLFDAGVDGNSSDIIKLFVPNPLK